MFCSCEGDRAQLKRKMTLTKPKLTSFRALPARHDCIQQSQQPPRKPQRASRTSQSQHTSATASALSRHYGSCCIAYKGQQVKICTCVCVCARARQCWVHKHKTAQACRILRVSLQNNIHSFITPASSLCSSRKQKAENQSPRMLAGCWYSCAHPRLGERGHSLGTLSAMISI